MTTTINTNPQPVTAPAFAAGIRGSLLGTALGDAFGYPLEFQQQLPSNPRATCLKPRQERWFTTPSWMGGVRATEPATVVPFSDDTQMMICVAEGLQRHPLARAEMTALEVTLEFLAWARCEENNRAPGSTVMSALLRMRTAEDWTKTYNASKGCGTIMRSQPYGWFYGPERAYRTARVHAEITHKHEAAVVAAAVYAKMISTVLRTPDRPLTDIIMEIALEASEPGHTSAGDTAYALRRMFEVLKLDIAPAARIDRIAMSFAGWTADSALACAVGLILSQPDDPLLCLQHAANTPGDSDSIAAVAGGLLGTRAVWPDAWVTPLEKYAYLEKLAARCAAKVVDL